MHIIANRCSVWRSVIGAVNLDGWPHTQSSVENQRNKMRLGMVILAYFTLRVSARGVEVAKSC
jgi:hypothetical protein